MHTNNDDKLLGIVHELLAEMHPRQAVTLNLDSRLERDLGLDSLTRVELIARLERAFDISLPERVLTVAETPRDLLAAIAQAEPASPARGTARAPVAPATAATIPLSTDALTDLVAVLDWHVQAHPERAHMHLLDEHGEEQTLSYAGLQHGADAVAAGLRDRGLLPGETVAIMLPTGHDYFFSFYGILRAGGIPVPIYPPMRVTQVEEHLQRHARILANAQTVLLITVPEARPLARLLQLQVESLRAVLAPADLSATPASGSAPNLVQDIAFLQYTSGSTGNPKGVVLTHANLLTNIRAMGSAAQVTSTDCFVSWMPLYHDMGLIGAWLGSLYFAMPLVVMSPLSFLAHPERWLWAIHRHRATLSGSPNFGYELCLRRIQDRDIQGLDLGSWRLAFNGAEPVSPDTLQRFSERFAPYGFRREALTPVYGLAESSLAVTFPPLGRAPVIDTIDRERFMRDGRAVPVAPDQPQALRFVACGQPFPGHEIRVVDATGHETGEREEGRLEFRGPSCTRGYYRNPDETRRLVHDGWLDSGDLAYLVSGEAYITGRIKDVIIRAGRNIYPHELEEAIGNLPGIRKGCVAVFGSQSRDSDTERLVVMAETRLTDPHDRTGLIQSVNTLASSLLGMPPDEIVLAAPHTVLKTSSGKIRRAASRALYERGEVGVPTRAPWRQVARLLWAGTGPLLRRVWRAVTALLYAGYAWLLFGIFAPLTWLGAVMLPGASRAQRWMRFMARALQTLSGNPLQVTGLEHIPAGPCVLAANHASYLDGIVLAACLPGPFSFIAKREFTGNFIADIFLRRIGAKYVERFDAQRGVADARDLALAVNNGRALVFFPEGTFTRRPGLLPFRLGAFVTAAEAGVPVVACSIRGTRSMLRADEWFPRRGHLRVHLSAPIIPTGNDWSAAIRLRDAVRAEILRHCGEPDLAQDPVTRSG